VSDDSIKQAQRVIEAAKLQDIRLVEASVKTSRGPNDGESLFLFIKETTSVKESDSISPFVALTDLKAQVSLSEDETDPPFLVKARFALSYTLPEGFQATKEEIAAFARVNAVFNAWPYFREYVQSTAARMMLPTVTLPLYRLRKPTPEKKSEPEKLEVAEHQEGEPIAKE
jgi:hypothetical protein